VHFTGEGDGAVLTDRHLRVLLAGTALVWLGTVALALTSDTPHLLLVALLPTAVVPVGFFVDARREHRRLRAELADHETRLALMLEAQQLTHRLAALTEALAATAVEHRHLVLMPADRDEGVERRPWARTARAAPPPQGLEP
jgi:hypothetical protein